MIKIRIFTMKQVKMVINQQELIVFGLKWFQKKSKSASGKRLSEKSSGSQATIQPGSLVTII